MNTQILQQQVDSAGNVGYVLLSTLDPMSPSDALAYLQGLPAGIYIAQLISNDGLNASIIAQVP